MARPPIEQVSDVERYCQHGNVRPSAGQLLPMVRRLEMETKPTVLFIMTDMLLDLAVADSGNSASYLDQAENTLTHITEAVEELGEAGYTRSFEESAAIVALAHFRLAELPNWAKAAEAELLESDYERVLRVGQSVLPLFASRRPDVESAVIECIPLLFGARALNSDGSNGWYGRLALEREDRGIHMVRGLNRNWDICVSRTPEAANFIRPPHRIQVKTSKYRSYGGYGRGGITELNATKCGFKDPLATISGLLGEYGLKIPEIPGRETTPLTTQELDTVTQKIFETMFTDNGANQRTRVQVPVSRYRTIRPNHQKWPGYRHR